MTFGKGKQKITWNKGLTKETDKRIKEIAKKISSSRRKGLKNGKIQVWNKGLTKNTDKRVLHSSIKLSRTKLKITGGLDAWCRKQARKIMGVNSPSQIVHHKDGNYKNNNPHNLQIVTRAEHVRIHLPRKKRNIELKGGGKVNGRKNEKRTVGQLG